MKIEVTDSSLCGIMDELAGAILVESQDDNNATQLNLPASIGEGKIQAYNFHNGLSLWSINAYLEEGLEIIVKQADYHPLRLVFCRSGKLTHSVDARLIQYQLGELQNSLSACSGSVDQNFRFHGNVDISIYMIEIDRAMYVEHIRASLHTIPAQLAKVFQDTQSEQPFLYQGFYSISAAEVLNNIYQTNFGGLILHTFLESKTLELLSLIMSQYTDDQKPSHKQTILREKDEAALLNARDIMLSNLSAPFTIKELARKVGINEYKLKVGYKQMFQTTIYKHVQNERLKEAKQLLQEGKWDIGEVAQKVGYSNKSHFSAKFKEKYGILPKQFQKNL